MVVAKYQPPQVNCYGAVESNTEKSCNMILDNMPANNLRQIFALDPDPRSGARKLPYRYLSCKGLHPQVCNDGNADRKHYKLTTSVMLFCQ